jgi:hypothetical protein
MGGPGKSSTMAPKEYCLNNIARCDIGNLSHLLARTGGEGSGPTDLAKIASMDCKLREQISEGAGPVEFTTATLKRSSAADFLQVLRIVI